MRVVNRLRDDSGAVLVWVALTMVVMLGFGALAVDIGYGYTVKREVSTTADGAALEGAQAAALEYSKDPSRSGCNGAVINAIKGKAVDAANKNIDSNTLPGTVTQRDIDVHCNGETIDVTVDLKTEIPTFFGKILNRDTMDPGSSATAQIAGSPAVGGLRPFAVCNADFPTGATPGKTYQTAFPQSSSQTGACGSASGQFGILDFDGGSNPTGDIQNWTRYGYPYEADDPQITVPGPIYGDPGAPGNWITDEMNYLVDNKVPVLLPIFDGWTGGGSGADVHASGVVSVQFCGWSLDPSKAPEHIDPTCWDGPLYASADDKSKFVFQWKYVAYSASYVGTGSGSACSLGVGCIPTTRLVK